MGNEIRVGQRLYLSGLGCITPYIGKGMTSLPTSSLVDEISFINRNVPYEIIYVVRNKDGSLSVCLLNDDNESLRQKPFSLRFLTEKEMKDPKKLSLKIWAILSEK